MSTPEYLGRPARELSDEELERQGKSAHETRNWAFLHGTAEQFATHTARMLELEREYLRRYPKRTWQGSGGAPAAESETAALRTAIASVVQQLQALLEPPVTGGPDSVAPRPGEDLATALLRAIADAPGGRMNKLAVHQLAREVGMGRGELAKLYSAQPPLLVTEKQDRVITDAGRAALAGK